MYLAACIIIKNEVEYIKEWLDFHLLVGFDKIIIYDNESSDNLKDQLEDYIQTNKVTYIYWDNSFVEKNHEYFSLINDEGKKNPQITAYCHALKTFTNFTWIAFIDSDEFLFSPIQKDLKKMLKEYEDFSSIAVYWKVFGTSNIIKKTHEPTLNKFTLRTKDSYHLNKRFKSIVQPKRTINVQTAHRFRTDSHPIIAHDENKKPLLFKGWEKLEPSTNIFRINHYFTKSKEEWEEKLKRGWLDIGPSRINFKIEVFNEIDKDTIEDKSILNIYNS